VLCLLLPTLLSTAVLASRSYIYELVQIRFLAGVLLSTIVAFELVLKVRALVHPPSPPRGLVTRNLHLPVPATSQWHRGISSPPAAGRTKGKSRGKKEPVRKTVFESDELHSCEVADVRANRASHPTPSLLSW
jgi:hypothetical protein